MNAPTSTTTRSERRGRQAAARAQVYRLLALAFADPSPGAGAALARQWPLTEAALKALKLAGATGEGAAIARADDDGLRHAHLAAFGHAISKECPPYGAEYGQAHIFEKAQTLADVAGFYRAFGLDLTESVHDRPDHLAIELEFMEFLCLKQALAEQRGDDPERLALCRDAQRAFLGDHLGFWAFSFAHRLTRKSASGPLAASVRLMELFLTQEMAAMGLETYGDPVVNEGTVDQPDDGACGACPVDAGPMADQGGVR